MACEELKAAYQKAFKQYLAEVEAGSPQPRTRLAGAASYDAGIEYRECLLSSNAIETTVELNGKWSYEGVPGPLISNALNSLSIDMSKYDRPTAHGVIVDATHITVTFPDTGTFTSTLVKETYTGMINPPEFIEWSNGTKWSKVYSARGIGTAPLDLERELTAQ